MPALFCCILNCEADSSSSKKRKMFYRLPQNVDRKQLWLGQIGDRIKYGSISSNSRICNAHFATGKPNLDSNHVDHVPTIFPWSSREDRSKSYQAVELYNARIKELEQKILAKAFLNASSVPTTPREAENCCRVSTLVDREHSQNGDKEDIKKESFATKAVDQQSQNMSRSTAEVCSTVTVSSDLLNYLISSLTQVHPDKGVDSAGGKTLPISITSFPINLSQSQSIPEDQTASMDCRNSSDNDLNSSTSLPVKTERMEATDQNGHTHGGLSTVSNPLGQLSGPAEEAGARSCTCTKSSCLKLYCECFANGNLCSSGCSCNNCRNNNNHKEERAKIVSSYLERDPWVFNSKIDHQDRSKKHSKGCNCLKSSCLKNYCECFENKVFCSSLCRCRMCCNNEDHGNQSHQREDVKIYPASLTSDSLSVASEESSKDCRKRKCKARSSDIYEDVSSNESGEDQDAKRRNLNVPAGPNPCGGRGVTTMEIPPVLPQEDDFTEEELAIMLKFKEQRSVKVESTTPPHASPRTQGASLSLHPKEERPSSSVSSHHIPTPPSVAGGAPPLDPGLLLSLTKSLACPNPCGGAGGLVNGGQPREGSKLSSSDLLSLLVTQQLLVSRQVAPSSHGLVVPASLGQPPCPPACAPPVTTSPPKTGPLPPQIEPAYCPSRAKLSTEDYVRRHIEAAERAVRADNLRRDCVGSKRAIAKQRAKADPVLPPQKAAPCLPPDPSPRGPGQQPVALTQSEEDAAVTKEPASIPRDLPNSPAKDYQAPLPPAAAATTGPSISNGGGLKMRIFTGDRLAKVASRTSSAPSSQPSDRRPSRTLSAPKRWRDKYQTLRRSLHDMRAELRAIKVHMRADHSKIRRLENALLFMSKELRN